MPHIAIIGAGDIGGALALQLSQQGMRVDAIRRSKKPLAAAHTNLTLHSLDVTQESAMLAFAQAHWQQAPDVVVYSIASPESSEAAYTQHYLHGLTHTLKALEQYPHTPKHVLFVSSTSVYHQDNGTWVDEHSPTEPSTYSGRIMLQAEQRLSTSPIASTAVRASGIYGPGRERLIRHAQQGGDCAHEPAVWSNRIHQHDLVKALAYLVEHTLAGRDLNPVVLATDHEPAPLHEVLAWLRRALGVSDIDPTLAPMGRRSTRRCNNAYLRALGYTFTYPSYREGYAAMLEQQPLQE